MSRVVRAIREYEPLSRRETGWPLVDERNSVDRRHKVGLQAIQGYQPLSSLRLDEISSERAGEFAAYRRAKGLGHIDGGGCGDEIFCHAGVEGIVA